MEGEARLFPLCPTDGGAGQRVICILRRVGGGRWWKRKDGREARRCLAFEGTPFCVLTSSLQWRQ